MPRGNKVQTIVEQHGGTVIVSGERESAGQIYYEYGIRAENPETLASVLENKLSDEWRVKCYKTARRVDGDVGGPYWYNTDTDEEIGSHIVVKKNLYNQHMM